MYGQTYEKNHDEKNHDEKKHYYYYYEEITIDNGCSYPLCKPTTSSCRDFPFKTSKICSNSCSTPCSGNGPCSKPKSCFDPCCGPKLYNSCCESSSYWDPCRKPILCSDPCDTKKYNVLLNIWSTTS
jgi:hypothetical protein